MYHDLNVCVPASEREVTLKTLCDLGYDVVAFTTTITPSNYNKKSNPAPPPPLTSVPNCTKSRKPVRVLQRLTVHIDEVNDLSILNNRELIKPYDLIAARPSNEKLLQQCLQSDGIDIITFDLHERLMFQLKRPHLHVAVEKGVLFEIAYAAALQGHVELRNVISNACNVNRTTKCEHVVLCSGATNLMQLRGPLDVINLGVLIHMNDEDCRNAVTKNAEQAVLHGHVRGRYDHGIVKITKVPNKGSVPSTSAS